MAFVDKLTAVRDIAYFLGYEGLDVDDRIQIVDNLVEQANTFFWNKEDGKAQRALDAAFVLSLRILAEEKLLAKYFLTGGE